MPFEFPEDENFFRLRLCEGDADLSRYYKLFDFRSPRIKRAEFKCIRDQIFKKLVDRYGKICQLCISKKCDPEAGLTVDHLIPLSTNKLNKELRNLKAVTGKKVSAQSFGSNNVENLLLACAKCNGHKKHQILSKQIMLGLLALKDW